MRIPELRLVYGDANGDGVINSEDIYLGSRNFGSTTLALALVATQQEPFTGDPIIRSTGVRLQGLDDSAGAFLLVDGQRHFVDPSGSSSFTVDPGPHDIQIRAPGYLPVDIVSPSGSNIVLGSGDVLTIPELTMVYGDANGDGAIDVRDLALGGRSFGETPEELELTPSRYGTGSLATHQLSPNSNLAHTPSSQRRTPLSAFLTYLPRALNRRAIDFI